MANDTILRDPLEFRGHSPVEGDHSGASGVPRAERLLRLYHTLSDTNEAIIRARSTRALFERVSEIALGLGGLRMVAIALHDRARGALVHEVATGPAGPLVLGSEMALDGSVPPGVSLGLDAFQTGLPQVRNHYEADTGLARWKNVRGPTMSRAAVCFPLRRAGEVIGFLGLAAESDGYFDSEVVHLLGAMAKDVSFGLDHLAATQALRESEERYRSLVDNLDDVVYTLDAQGRFTFVSASVARYGFAPQDIVGLPFDKFVRAEDAATATGAFSESMAGRRVLVDVRARDATGKVRFLRGSSRPLFQEGRFVGQQGVLTDLTQQHEIEEQLRMSQKMEAIGRLAGGVAHDFNNLLMVILSYTDFAMEALGEDDPVRADIDEARKASLRAVGLTRQLLAFSRKQLLRPEVLDLNGLIGGLEKMLRRLLGEDVELTFAPGPGLGATKADAGQIEQVLMNLVVNARDAMPNGGSLHIATSNAEVDDDFASRYLGMRPGSYVKISVTDTGVGMDEATQARIFEPFFTTKAAGKGTGLGLATAYGILKQSGGGIWVQSSPGCGATFDIFLPCASGGCDAQARAVSRTPRRGSEVVLLVEDDEAVRKLTQRILVAAGYQVAAAASGAQALQISADQERIDLLVTDVVMPGMNGRDLWERLRKLRPELKVLYMSGYTDDVLEDRGALDPDTHLVGKPFSADVLLRQVRAVLGPG